MPENKCQWQKEECSVLIGQMPNRLQTDLKIRIRAENVIIHIENIAFDFCDNYISIITYYWGIFSEWVITLIPAW